MKLLFSIPSGYHLRELVMPLRRLLEADTAVDKIYCLTPGARWRERLFSDYSDKFEWLANPATLADHHRLLQRLQPDLIVTDTVGHDAKDYPILQAGLDLSIKTLTFIASWDNVWKIARLIKSGTPVAVADQFIVWNEMMRDHLLRTFSNLAADSVAVIGAPRLDYFWHQEKIPTKQALYDWLGLADERRPLIHFATTELYPMEYVVKVVAEAVRQKQIKQQPYFYASVHPGGNIVKHQALKKYGAVVRLAFGRQANAPLPEFAYNPSEQDIYMLVALFKQADLLINHSSSTALESLIAGTPVINVKYGQSFDWWRWYHSMVYRDFKQHYLDLIADGATYVVSSPRQLITAVQQALANRVKDEGARQATVKRMITTTDGTASQKVLNLLKEVVES